MSEALGTANHEAFVHLAMDAWPVLWMSDPKRTARHAWTWEVGLEFGVADPKRIIRHAWTRKVLRFWWNLMTSLAIMVRPEFIIAIYYFSNMTVMAVMVSPAIISRNGTARVAFVNRMFESMSATLAPPSRLIACSLRLCTRLYLEGAWRTSHTRDI